jgi:mannose-6-phosphate isomerase-like protein (cupin superfamily)
MKISFWGLIIALGIFPAAFAQQTSASKAAYQPPVREDALNPTPVDRMSDPDIDMFVNDYRDATPRTEHGAMVFYDILTRRGTGDIMRPVQKGAVLSNMIAASRATLEAGATATGRVKPGSREAFIAVEGTGTITVGGKAYPVASGSYFQLTPDLDFSLTNTGRTPIVFYVRTEPLPVNFKIPAFDVVNRYDNDRVFGAHWSHSCDMVASGPNTKVFPPMTFCSMSPYSMPQPHSHPGEEVWIQVEGVTTLSLGKRLLPLRPGQAYRIPPDGVTAHSNLNLTDRMTKILYLGPIDRPADNAWITGRGLPLVGDYSRLDNRPLDPPNEQDVEMYIANWRDAYPQIRHGNMYVREMLTALSGPDALHPTRTGAVLSNAAMVSFGMLEPYSKAHPVPGETPNIQEIFIVNSGDGVITSGGKAIQLSRDKVVIVPPGVEYTITAGSDYMTFYIVGEKLPDGFKPAQTLSVIDHSKVPAKTVDWVDTEHTLASKGDGLSQYSSVTRVDMPSEMAMARPTSTAPGTEEIWIATDGDVDMLFGRRLRKLPDGTAYRVPPTGITARAHINTSGKPASFIRLLK